MYNTLNHQDNCVKISKLQHLVTLKMTETMSVYTTREVSLESCLFTKPEKFENYHESYLKVNGSRGFVLQSPKLILRNSTENYFEMLISRNKDRHREFYNIISHLEDTAIIQTAENSKEWFNREIKRDQVETMFRSCIHRPLDINDSYILRINKVSGLEADINYPVVCLIKIEGILFGKNTSMLDIKVVQAKVVKTEKIISDELSQSSITMIQPEKPFYNDNVSVVPSHYKTTMNDIEEAEKVVEKIVENQVDEVDEVGVKEIEIGKTEEVEKVEDINTSVEEVEQNISDTSVKHIDTSVKQTEEQTPSIDELKLEMIEAMSNHNYARVKELSDMLQSLKTA